MYNMIVKSIESYIECQECGYQDTGRYYLDAIISLYIDCQFDPSVTNMEKEMVQRFADLAARLRDDNDNSELFCELVVALGNEYQDNVVSFKSAKA